MREIIKKENKNQEFFDLCKYIEKEIFKYDENQKLKQASCLQLRGLVNGKDFGHREYNGESKYPIKSVLIAFQINKNKILNSIQGKNFTNEISQMRYICKIIENDIPNIYMRLKNAEKAQESIQNIDTDILSHNGGTYQKKTEDLKNERLNELW